jgi:hypothetical protein
MPRGCPGCFLLDGLSILQEELGEGAHDGQWFRLGSFCKIHVSISVGTAFGA